MGQRPGTTGFELEEFKQQDGNQCRPNLNMDGVGARADESLDQEILFQRFEEELDLPAFLIDRRDGLGRKVFEVGEQY